MSDDPATDGWKYCEECGQQLRSDAGFCDRCGTEQSWSDDPQETARRRTQPQQTTRRGPQPQTKHSQTDNQRSLLKKILIGIGVLAVVLFISTIVSSFVLGIGDDPQAESEEVLEKYLEARADGNADQALSLLHDDGPAADNATGDILGYLQPSNTDVAVLDSEVLEERDSGVLLNAEIEYDDFGSEPETITSTVEFRKDGEDWRIWAFGG